MTPKQARWIRRLDKSIWPTRLCHCPEHGTATFVWHNALERPDIAGGLGGYCCPEPACLVGQGPHVFGGLQAIMKAPLPSGGGRYFPGGILY